jgi:spore photoproduct lyase
MNQTKYVQRKALDITESGRSTDYISPSFIFGCGYECAYCYCKRHVNDGISIATNTGQLLDKINSHVHFYADVIKPNQTHSEYITYDIGCNSDMALHLKQWDWDVVFDFFKNHPMAMGSFATKYVNESLLRYNPCGKIRIRFSLMPQAYSNILEPRTSKIIDRIKAINRFIEAGYDVHINFSPVIVQDDWLYQYRLLFEGVDALVDIKYKDRVKAEVIFLTHNEKKHIDNLSKGIPGEDMLWKPDMQEYKFSQTGGKNIRYKRGLKSKYIEEWTRLHDQVIPWNKIRYIF